MLERVRKSLLEEALKSPTLLSDLAGLEQYVAESYDARAFVELLQNADDSGASCFTVLRAGRFLFAANNGHCFTESEFESLCRSAASSKHRGEAIGFRGIGFKSVVGLAKTVHVISGELQATFSRQRTTADVPQASRVPLIRIPHPLLPAEQKEFDSQLAHLIADRFNTIFVFDGLTGSSIESEFAAFDPSSLLFLRNVRQMQLKSGVETVVTVQRQTDAPGLQSLRLASSDGVRKWSVMERDGFAFAFVHDAGGVSRLAEPEAVIHAFLPTHEPTGFAFKINGDISTDPSRTRVVLDESTLNGIRTMARFYLELIGQCLNGTAPIESEKLFAALIPYSNLGMVALQRRSFKTEFVAALKNEAKDTFADLFLSPVWLNAADFEKLSKASAIKAVPRALQDVDGVASLLRFLGAKEAKLDELSSGLTKTEPSIAGAAEVVAHIANLHATKQIEASSVNESWRIWPSEDVPVSLSEAKRSEKPLAEDFLDMVTEKTGTPSHLNRLVQGVTNSQVAKKLVPSDLSPSPVQQSPESVSPETPTRLSLTRWRAAEQQVLELLEAWGWQATDVSRQNLGYDIEATTPDNEERFLEVKSIDYPGQPFTMTSNEEAVARQKGKAYRLVLVRQTSSDLEVAFIEDPVHQLRLTRQCRQWVWECAAYEFVSERFPLE
jgi:hypothetical protein